VVALRQEQALSPSYWTILVWGRDGQSARWPQSPCAGLVCVERCLASRRVGGTWDLSKATPQPPDILSRCVSACPGADCALVPALAPRPFLPASRTLPDAGPSRGPLPVDTCSGLGVSMPRIGPCWHASLPYSFHHHPRPRRFSRSPAGCSRPALFGLPGDKPETNGPIPSTSQGLSRSGHTNGSPGPLEMHFDGSSREPEPCLRIAGWRQAAQALSPGGWAPSSIAQAPDPVSGSCSGPFNPAARPG